MQRISDGKGLTCFPVAVLYFCSFRGLLSLPLPSVILMVGRHRLFKRSSAPHPPYPRPPLTLGFGFLSFASFCFFRLFFLAHNFRLYPVHLLQRGKIDCLLEAMINYLLFALTLRVLMNRSY